MADERRPGPPGPLRRILRAYRCEALKASRQPALAVYALIVLTATLYASWTEYSREPDGTTARASGVPAEDSDIFGDPEEPEAPKGEPGKIGANGFTIFASGARVGFLVGAVLILLFSANLLAGEAGGGTFRLLLVRPVTKTDLILAKWMLLVTAVITFSLVATISAWLAGHLLGGYVDVTEFYTAGLLTERSLVCAAVTPLGLLAFAGLGLFLSSVFQSPAASVTAASLAGVLAFGLTYVLAGEDSLYNLATYATQYMDRLVWWARGESGHAFSYRMVRPALFVPPAYAFAFLLGARIIFGRRDIHS